MKPSTKPLNPNFSSGPCSKRPGYDLSSLVIESLGRSHRSAIGKKTLQLAIDKTAEILGVPDDYRIGIVPASDTGAVEMAMWDLLGKKCGQPLYQLIGGLYRQEIELAACMGIRPPDEANWNNDYNKKNRRCGTTEREEREYTYTASSKSGERNRCGGAGGDFLL